MNKYNFSCDTKLGFVRSENQDSIKIIRNKDNAILGIVCDGMGGHIGGKEASTLTLNFFVKEFLIKKFNNLSEKNIFSFIYQTIFKIQEKLTKIGKKNKSLEDMGTTIALVILVNDKLYTYHAGDSRIYLMKTKNNFMQITLDHSFKNYSTFRNIENNRLLVHALGPGKFSSEEELIYSCQSFDLTKEKKFTILLCTDGIYEYVSENELYSKLKLNISCENKVQTIMNLAIKNETKDNFSVGIIEFRKTNK